MYEVIILNTGKVFLDIGFNFINMFLLGCYMGN